MQINEMLQLLGKGTLESLYMTVLSTVLAYALGLPMGILLVITDNDGIAPCVPFNRILGVIVNVIRSVPFLILLVTVIPITRAIVGTSLGSTATIVPLVIGSAPFVARMVESSLKEVDHGIVEAAQSMGATPFQLITRVLVPEAKPSLLVGSAITITTILGYSALAGFTGGGGLGTIAVNYGYYRYQTDVMLVTVLVLVILVQIFQEIGMYIANHSDKRRR